MIGFVWFSVLLCPSVCVPSVRCSESSMLVSLRLCLKGESKKCSRAPRGLEESRGVLRRDVLLSRAMRPPSIKSDTLPSVPLSPCTDAIQLLKRLGLSGHFHSCILLLPFISHLFHIHTNITTKERGVNIDLKLIRVFPGSELAFGGRLGTTESTISLRTVRAGWLIYHEKRFHFLLLPKTFLGGVPKISRCRKNPVHPTSPKLHPWRTKTS